MPKEKIAQDKLLEDKLITVNFGELWLRGRNRGNYIKMLRSNMMQALAGERCQLEQLHDRFAIRLYKSSDADAIMQKAARVFGVSKVSISYACKPDMDSIAKLGTRLLTGIAGSGAVKVKIDAHRSHKGFDFNSLDIIARLVKAAHKLKLAQRMHGYDALLNVNVTKDKAYFSTGHVKGMSGLPLGSSGRSIVLFSGGIDSPVAAWYMMKRGSIPIFVHFHPFTSSEGVNSSKIPRILRILKGFCPMMRVYYIPSHLFQAAAMKTDGRYESLLFKAFILRVAEKIAKKENAHALCTGEALGQVASQTMLNLYASEQGTKMPIFRPLIGFDKQEIIDVAKRIGTYEESIKPYKDVCSISAKNPVTNASAGSVAKMLKDMKMSQVVTRSLRLAQCQEL